MSEMNKIREICGKIRENKAARIISYVSLAFFPLFCLFIMDYFNFYPYNRIRTVLDFLQKHPLSFLFEVLVMFLLFFFLLLILKKGWAAGAVLGVLSFLCAYINFVKVALNGDNFFPKDVLMAGNAGELISFITCPMPKWFYIGVLLLILWIAFLIVTDPQLPLGRFVRYPVAIVLAAAVVIGLSGPARSGKVLSTFGMSYMDAALQNSNYKANGFVGAFMVNLLSMQVDKPADYSRETMDAILADYTETGMEDGAELFDVIVVLNESFCDIRMLPGVAFSENPLKNYDEILERENCYSGSVYTTAIGGGTVRPEFEILTGLTADYLPGGASPYGYVNHAFETYVTNYGDAGYETAAIHLYDKSFYARESAYGYVGFDVYYGLEDMKEIIELDYKRGYATDAATLKAMKYCMEQAEEPLFLSVITIQNHQAYNAMAPEDITVEVSSDVLDESPMTALTTYTQGLNDADEMLGELVQYIDSRERPTILLFYGDHLPTLGANHAAYNQTGYFNSEEDGVETRMRMYSTPFLIYANRDISPGMFAANKGNQISTYNLLNAVAASTGFTRTPYMNMLAEFYKEEPFYNLRLLPPKTETETETKTVNKYYENMRYITYDRVVGKGYSQR